MIDGYTIMTTLRDTLTADATLNGLLGTMPGKPKVLLGGSPAAGTQVPVIMIPDSNWTPDWRHLRSGQSPQSGEFAQDINIWAKMLANGMEDFDGLYDLCRRVSTLLNGTRINTTDTLLAGLRLVEVRPAVVAEDLTRCYKTMSFRGLASQK